VIGHNVQELVAVESVNTQEFASMELLVISVVMAQAVKNNSVMDLLVHSTPTGVNSVHAQSHVVEAQ